MARRTRSFIIDNTLGRIFTGAVSVEATTPANLIAGQKSLSKSLTSKNTTPTKVVKNIGNTPVGLTLDGASGLVNQVTLTCATPPKGSSIVVVVRKGETYDTSSAVATVQLPALMTSSATVVNIPYSTPESFFFDVTQIGSVFRGVGLSVTLTYYAG